MAEWFRHLRRLAAGIGIAAFSLLSGAPAGAETRILITLEWPPYTGIHEPGGGTVTTLVNKVFKAMGDNTRIGYFPWRRVLELPATDRRFAASFPMYYSEERARRCWFSDPIGEGPVGIAQRKDRPVDWHTVSDLERYTVGVVKGYVNTPEFDALVRAGQIRTLASDDDTKNLRNLLRGRVQAAVVDENTFHYLARHEPALAGMEESLELNQSLLTVNKVYMCFPKDAAGQALRDRFNQTLHRFDTPLPGHYRPLTSMQSHPGPATNRIE